MVVYNTLEGIRSTSSIAKDIGRCSVTNLSSLINKIEENIQ